jgi:hypothetical protein
MVAMMPWFEDMNIEAPIACADRAAISTGRLHERAEQGTQAEDEEAVIENAHLAQLVRDFAEYEDEGGDNDEVARDHPLDPVQAHAQARGDGGQGHIDDAAVQAPHEWREE